MPETLILGLGGTGAAICRHVAQRLATLDPAGAARHPSFLVVETGRADSSGGGGGAEPGDPVLPTLRLGASAAVLDAAYRQPERFRAEWLDRAVLHGRVLPERGVQGCRMLARFLLFLPENRAALRERLAEWLRHSEGAEAAPRRIVVVGSAAGGTGGGLVVDVGYLAQHVAAGLGAEVETRALLLLPPPGDASLAPNACATLLELSFFADPLTVYRAHLDDSDGPFRTRRAPYRRVALLGAATTEGEILPLAELEERAAVYLALAEVADTGAWAAERAREEAAVRPTDADGNPQLFTTFGIDWIEYPEERLVGAVYRNLVRRSLHPWLHGDAPVLSSELPHSVPLKDSEALARRLLPSKEEELFERLLRPVRTRRPWIHRAPAYQWHVMDRELAAGAAEFDGRPSDGPMADAFRTLRDRVLEEHRRQAAVWLARENVSLERVARVLNEVAAELKTATDPAGAWGEALKGTERARRRILRAAGAVRRDPFLFFWRGMALRRLALEYERVAPLYVRSALRVAALPLLAELRRQLLEPVRVWAGRISRLAGVLARLSRSMADFESHLLEGLRAEAETGRLALGLLQLPGAETPYIAQTGWNLPYCRPEEEEALIRELRRGWIELLVERPEGLLAPPTRSALDGPAGMAPEERLPWLLPSAFARAVAAGASGAEDREEARIREVVLACDRQLRARVEERLRNWLSATVFQRLAEALRTPIELEYRLRQLVSAAAALPALEPAHARPADLPRETERLLFGEAKEEVPAVLRMVAESAGGSWPLPGAAAGGGCRVIPSRLPHLLAAVTEHPGFALSRCPFFHQMEETHRELGGAPLPFNRIDIPWASARPVTRERMQEAAEVLFLALAWGVLRPLPGGAVPLPAALLDEEAAPASRLPLPPRFELAVRQLAGDPVALRSVARAVDRTFQSRGVEWCALHLERAVARGASGEHAVFGPEGMRFLERAEGDSDAPARLAALRAAARYDELLDEFAGTPIARETAWLRRSDGYACPACGAGLGADPESLPGRCPRCRALLLPHREGRAAARDGFRRIPNPYVVGTPLETGSGVFVGREDILRQVRDRLIRPASRTILILIGERRCGKTSALKQLPARLSGDLTPLFIDMQGLTATDLPGFLYWLAWRMADALGERGIRIDLPSWEQFSQMPPDYQFETAILPEVRRKLQGGRVLLMLDEFEVLAQRVMQGAFDPRAFDYLRHLMQHGEGIEFLFAGTHVLRQFAANYATFLFNIGVFLNVDFLQREDALRLVREPVAGAGVTFDPEALEAVLELGGAHAYFTQMFGFHLVERLNRLRKRHVTREDVEAESGPVIAAAGAHLDHVWNQLSDPERLLIAFFVDACPRGQAIAEEELLARAAQADPALRPYLFRAAVEKLTAVGLLRATTTAGPDGAPRPALALTAEVYRQWLQQAHSYRRLREEGVRWA